ncbi:hypothetical protein [Jonesia quinghaiensis]|uniref:hypothetical protein n=1 Tax=Jonesia quinghaiensis TaxID=262806 RepID=UPI000414DA83|nr:hypothetical protein [Jonesia quinghaiensis]
MNPAKTARRATRKLSITAAGAAQACSQAMFDRLTDMRTNSQRGDVPGWVLITLMTAGLVVAIWSIAGPALESLFNEAIAKVSGR